MNKSLLFITLLLLIAPLLAQQIKLTDQELSNAALLTQLNNYFGCKVWSNDVCLECSERYFFNSKGVCCEVQGTCQQFNTKEGICQKCYEGYSVVDGKCTAVSTTSQENIGCASWKGGVCAQCSKRWYFNQKRTCVPVSDLCSTWNDETGACESCYYGYIVSSGVCVVNNDLSVVPNSNLLCKTWSGSSCIQCASRTYFNEKGICTSVSDQCNTFDKATGNCLSCFDGYDISQGKCVYSPSNTASPADLGCASWNWKEGKCLACSNRWAFNEQNICVPVSDQCATSDKAGLCTSCYKGYDLKEGKCLYSLSNDAKPADLGCGVWNWDEQVCLKCSSGWVFNSNKVCVPVSDLCKAHAENGDCTECFKGYDLKEGKCVFSESNNAKPSDSGCATWNWDEQVCLKCSSGWVFNQKKVCVPVSDQCKAHAENGDCTECFKGYDLKEGKCVFSESNNAKPSDSGCASWNWDEQVCLKCSSGWVFNSNKVCVPVSDQCKAHADNGDCTECFKGYDLKEGKCIFSDSNNAHPSDSGCATWNWDDQKCLKCSNNWTFNKEGVCVPVSDQCKTHADNGDCTSCFLGYDLKDGKCIFSESNNAKPSDSGCATWDWSNQICLKCSNRWTFNSNKVCVPVSDQCKTHAENGDCQTCFQGYDLKNGQCIFSESNNAKPSDSGCATWDWNNQVCLKCSNGWVFNANKVCVAVSDLCKTYGDHGDCTSCYSGYDLKNGQCIFSESNNAHPSDLGCGTWDWQNQVCLKCSNRWFFNSHKKCVPVDDNCNTYSDNGSCTSCYQGYGLSDGICVSVNPLCKTLNADGTCASCYPQNILHKGNCVPISKLANILLYYAECCPEKLQALQAQVQSGN